MCAVCLYRGNFGQGGALSIFPTHPRLRGLVARVAARDQLGTGAPPCQGPAGDRTVVQGRVSGPLRWSAASRPRSRSHTGGPHAAPFLGVWGVLTDVGPPLFSYVCGPRGGGRGRAWMSQGGDICRQFGPRVTRWRLQGPLTGRGPRWPQASACRGPRWLGQAGFECPIGCLTGRGQVRRVQKGGFGQGSIHQWVVGPGSGLASRPCGGSCGGIRAPCPSAPDGPFERDGP